MNKPKTLLHRFRSDSGHGEKRLRNTATILLAVLLTACGGERKNDPLILTDDTLNTALTRIIDQTVIPSVEAFSSDTDALVVATSDFCSGPDTDGLEQVQSAWEKSTTSWYRILPFLFGPPDDNLLTPVICLSIRYASVVTITPQPYELKLLKLRQEVNH